MNKKQFERECRRISQENKTLNETARIADTIPTKAQRILELVLNFLISSGKPSKPFWLWVIRRIPALASLIGDVLNVIRE